MPEPHAKHGLTERHLNILRSVLSPFADQIELVGLFGSRAKGTAHDNSDIDMVLYGAIDGKSVNQISASLSESMLPVTVDIVTYNALAHAPLKAHIDTVMQPLFTHNDLLLS
jgi:predicted nucleotidyltransferase